MNICVLTHTFPRFSGDPTAPFMIGVCEGLAKAGNKVFVLTPYHIDFTNTQYKLFTLKTYQYIFPDFLHTLGYSQSLKNDKTLTVQSLLLAPFMIIAGFFSLLLLVKKEKIDVVSAHWILPNGFIAVLVKFFTGVKVVSTLPGSDVYIARQHWFFRAMAYVATTYSDGITSNSPE